MHACWRELPADIVNGHILLYCSIDTRRAFGISPQKLVTNVCTTRALELWIDRHLKFVRLDDNYGISTVTVPIWQPHELHHRHSPCACPSVYFTIDYIYDGWFNDRYGRGKIFITMCKVHRDSPEVSCRSFVTVAHVYVPEPSLDPRPPCCPCAPAF